MHKGHGSNVQYFKMHTWVLVERINRTTSLWNEDDTMDWCNHQRFENVSLKYHGQTWKELVVETMDFDEPSSWRRRFVCYSSKGTIVVHFYYLFLYMN